jgi:hypothetical protein
MHDSAAAAPTASAGGSFVDIAIVASASPRIGQILGKFHFFKLRENLRRILFDYAEKRSGIANAPFNAAC